MACVCDFVCARGGRWLKGVRVVGKKKGGIARLDLFCVWWCVVFGWKRTDWPDPLTTTTRILDR